MQRLTYVVLINLVHYYEKRPAVRAWSTSSRFRLCTSLVPRFGLGTRLNVRMRTKLENGVLRKGSAAAVCCEWHNLGKLRSSEDAIYHWTCALRYTLYPC